MSEAESEPIAVVSYFSDGEDLSGEVNITCTGCGTTMLDLYRDGRMGCAQCYITFSSTVHRALIVLHGAPEHVGKKVDREQNYQ